MKKCLIFILLLFSQAQLFSQILSANPRNGSTYVIAHRGAHNGIPENSIPAYQKAIELGCDFVEIDIRTTRDNQYVSIHNSTIDAYEKGESGEVKDLTLAEIKSLDIGEKFGKKWENTRIPTFEEILQLCKGKIGIYLDLKDADPAGLISLIKKYHMEEDIVWFVWAYKHDIIMEITRECPRCIVMPDPGKVTNIEKVIYAYQPAIVASSMQHYTKAFGESVHTKGVKVFVDESKDDLHDLKKEWDTMINWGADGIQTDYPEELIKFLSEYDK